MSTEELKTVVGGASWGIWTFLGAAVTFALGFFEGFVNPIKCGR